MAYAPIIDIPLQSLNTSLESLRSSQDSDTSATSEYFEDIDRYKHDHDQELDFVSDPNFQTQLQNFKSSKGSHTKIYALISFFLLCSWAAALFIYLSRNTHQQVLSTNLNGDLTNIASLSDRDIFLNKFLPEMSNITFEKYRKASYVSSRKRVEWLLSAQFPKSEAANADGFYLTETHDGYVVAQHGTSFQYKLLLSLQFSFGNDFFYVEDIVLNPGTPVDDTSLVHILVSDIVTQWRHSSFAIYWIWSPSREEFFPIQPPGADNSLKIEKLHFAKFCPSGNYVVYGYNHDLYLYDVRSKATKRVTSSGSFDVFNGKPDFVYEEEVVGGDKMVWWRPDLSALVYATLNDTLVENYELDYYVKDPKDIPSSYSKSNPRKVDDLNQYPTRASFKYPKPGTHIPVFSLNFFNLTLGQLAPITGINDSFLGKETILYDAFWVDNDNLLLKISDRSSTKMVKKVFDPKKFHTRNVSSINTSEFGGWIEKAPRLLAIPGDGKSSYLDRVVVNELVQLALFDLPTSSNYSKVFGPVSYHTPIAYNAMENSIYGLFGTDFNHTFGAMSLDGGGLVKIQENGKYVPRFSPDGHFVDLEYAGPLVPWQKLMNMADFHSGTRFEDIEPCNDHSSLSQIVQTTNMPTRIYNRIKVGTGKYAVELNMVEIFPPGFNPNMTYPLLVYAYGGPGAAIIDYAFKVEFQDIASAQLNAIVLIIDPRGTSHEDWKLKSYATEQLGFWEPRDLVAVTKDYIRINKYVDKTKTAIWGWSYGGFTTLKTLEFDKGETFKFGAAVAPVTNWMFYDAIYTERYMKDISNPNYKAISRINGFENFKGSKRFLIMHGSADDNVHLQNTMWLLDNFDVANVENYDIHIYPDSDHSIYYHNANGMLYDRLFWWLEKAFLGFYD